MSDHLDNKMETPLNVIKVEDTITLRCSNCEKDLLVMYEMKTGKEKLFDIQSSCCFCGDNSFVFPLFGTLKYLPARGVAIKNVQSLPGNVMKFLTVKAK